MARTATAAHKKMVSAPFLTPAKTKISMLLAAWVKRFFVSRMWDRRIGQEILCLPYVGFFLNSFQNGVNSWSAHCSCFVNPLDIFRALLGTLKKLLSHYNGLGIICIYLDFYLNLYFKKDIYIYYFFK